MLIAGEASWLRCGLIRHHVHDSVYCELAAVAFALRLFRNEDRLAAGDRLHVCTDSLTAVHLLSGKTRPKHQARSIMDAVRRNSDGLEVTYSWVRSHQGDNAEDWRGLINGRVDRQARWAVREHRRATQTRPESEAAE